MCAVRAAENHPKKRIVILEKADRVGKKILVSGNGRCNLSHIGADEKSYHGEGSSAFINILFKKYNPKEVIRYFQKLGLLTRTDAEGRVYPLSNQSSSVLDVLRKRLRELGVEELCGVDITDIKSTSQGYDILTDGMCISAERLVVATGGKTDHAGRESGSRDILRMLGLPVNALSPSLSPVRAIDDSLRSLKGIRADAQVSLIKGERVIKTERGELQFAENALSGICVFNLSREANLGGCEIAVDLLPDMTGEAVISELRGRISRDPDAVVTEIFTGMFHKNIGLSLLKASGIKPNTLCENISEKEINIIANNISDRRYKCEQSADFRKAQVTAGGAPLKEIDPHTYGSKKHKGLYIIGEALDIDGDCGGYNLQFAFASGMCAGDSL